MDELRLLPGGVPPKPIAAPSAAGVGVLPPQQTIPCEAPAQVAALLDQGTARQLSRIPRSNLKAMTVKFLKDQGGVCAICGRPIDLRILREGVVDHDHNTGEVRGVLHRSCNGAEGKVANAAGRWGAGGMDYALIIPWLERMLAYLKKPGTGYMYPTHKTPEEKKQAQAAARKRTRASTQARAKVRSMKKET